MYHSFVKIIKKPFYYKIDDKVLHLQSVIEHFPSSHTVADDICKIISNNIDNLSSLKSCSKQNVFAIGGGYKLDTQSDVELQLWANIVNSSYGDCNLTITDSKKLLCCHPFYDKTETYIFCDTERSTIYATISIGQYKENPNVGAVYRIAVANSLKRKGIGIKLILFGYSKLRERGLKYGESIIASKRKPSFVCHSMLGFRPQLNNRYISYHGSIKNTNLIQRIRLKYRAKMYFYYYLSKFNKLYEVCDNRGR